MKQKNRIIMNIIWIILGAILIGLSITQTVDDFWSGMGSGLLTVGALQLLRSYRLNKNAAYREKVEIEINDERNKR